MKTELKAKFLQHLVQKKQDKGFTLIELLVVIIIIGILSAIALPSFLNQAAKAKQTEAKNYVGSTNRAQQAYRIEKPKFAGTWSDLEIGIPDKTQDYTYTLGAGNETTATVTADSSRPLAQRLHGWRRCAERQRPNLSRCLPNQEGWWSSSSCRLERCYWRYLHW
jgi:type IV pilus assembly protein PilA